MQDLTEMSVSEHSVVRKPKSVVIRMLGIFAFLLGLPYLIQGVTLLILFFSGQYEFFRFQLLVSTIALDFVLGLAPPVMGVGLFLHKEWARQSWLAFLLVALFVHLHMTVLQLLVGVSGMTELYKWIVVVILVTIISWAFLSKASIKARFD